MQKFPLNYFANLRSPQRLFLSRRQLSWPKFILVYLFLVSLLVMPITLFYTKQVTAIPMEQFLTVDELIQEADVNRLQGLKIVNRQMEAEKGVVSVSDDVIIGVDLTKEQQQTRNASINFENKQWTIQQSENGKVRSYQMNYPPMFDLSTVATPQSFQQFLETAFYMSNQPMIILSYSLSLGILLFLMTGLLLFGGAFFLWMTRKSNFSSIVTFKESANLMLNVLGVGSIAAALISLIHFDFILMMGVQSTTTVLMLLWIFAKTKFKDPDTIQVSLFK
ncbi:malA2 [Enterococcus sp. 10A9_DIV0425]|uniref:MalA2 n=1 Tax=Candidatus Enterococcus wittei TaxID=1987383 RepID=A0A2C9XNX5_9ENTE|nr:maltodextrose utilization protein MalA [Enterococcus sp. 10A9_DIV0425]OTP11861.1 malA2 [Enterococcus sp. 10A9_DIV0425]